MASAKVNNFVRGDLIRYKVHPTSCSYFGVTAGWTYDVSKSGMLSGMPTIYIVDDTGHELEVWSKDFEYASYDPSKDFDIS